MADTYEPYEPPAGGTTPDGEGAGPEPQWPLLPDQEESGSAAPAPRAPARPRPYWRAAPSSQRGAAPAIVAVVAMLAVGVGAAVASQSDEPAEADYRDQWEECLAEEQGNGGLLEPEELCSIRFPDGEDDYGDLGYDNPEDEYDWYVEE